MLPEKLLKMNRESCFALCMAACWALAGCGAGQVSVSPVHKELRVPVGANRAYEVQIEVPRGGPTLGPVDVLFLFDDTSSMANVVGSVTARSRQVFDAVRAQDPDSRFAVASFGDYRDPTGVPVWRLHSDFTASLDAARAALGAITITDGLDYPEAYSRGLYESQFLDWRSEAQKYIVLFGDAPAHDPSQFGVDLGVDPGRDGIPGTADDLRIADVVRQLAARGIHVFTLYDRGGIFSRKPMQQETRASMKYIADGTGGFTAEVDSSDKIPDLIVAQLRRIPPGVPGLRLPSNTPAWLSLTTRTVSAAPGVARFQVRANVSGLAQGREVYSGQLAVVEAGARNVEPIAISMLEVHVPESWWAILKRMWPWLLLIVLGPLLLVWLLRRLAAWAGPNLRYGYARGPLHLLGPRVPGAWFWAALLVIAVACFVWSRFVH